MRGRINKGGGCSPDENAAGGLTEALAQNANLRSLFARGRHQTDERGRADFQAVEHAASPVATNDAPAPVSVAIQDAIRALGQGGLRICPRGAVKVVDDGVDTFWGDLINGPKTQRSP